MDDELEVDHERFIYETEETFSGETFTFRVGCYHKNVDLVRTLMTGAVVARLCVDCGDQLPVEGQIEW